MIEKNKYDRDKENKDGQSKVTNKKKVKVVWEEGNNKKRQEKIHKV